MTQPTFVLSNRRSSEHSLAASASASTTTANRKALAPPQRNSTNPNMDANIATVASISTPRTTTTYEPAPDVSRFMSTLPLPVSVSAATMDPVHNSPSPHQTALALAGAYNDVNTAAFELHSSSSSSISDLSSSTTKIHGQPGNAPCKAPANFGIVAPGIYRSDFPKTENLSFLGTLGLKTIITLVKKDSIDPDFAHFMAANDINHCVVDMEGTKKKAIPADVMNAIMETVCDKRNQPVLVHCNHGKHRTGCVIGVLRHLSGWTVSDILAEYNLYAGEKARDCDLAYLANFDISSFASSPGCRVR
ncbi:putative tyrosine-protein phosphatase [Ceratocystis fimbriata CBS 114723]|uniref:diphosphoinositol-polyphosphate diphosphatase n=1 Tax=Ceratocystis fimbriata CBS 114723 TaxID=1035309 RepID=A0A2C5X096_9PEZI|nr:putative tyrosine-protein phosphatase [Ceratocystis fimbriata CBS 114723]